MQIAETGLKMNVWEESKESINVVRGEAKARKLKITVVEPVRVTDSIGNESVELKPIDLTGKTIELWAKKSDGTEACSQGEVTDAAKGECTVGITSQMCAEPSSVIPLVELRIIDAETGAMLKAKGPTINVLNGIDDSGVVSSDDYSVLVQTIAEANAAIGKAESALTTAEKANSTANKAVADLGDLIPRGEAATTAATNAAAAANTAADSANAAVQEATTAAEGANTAKAAAETAATAANEAAEAAGQVSGKLDAHTANTSDPHHTLAYITQGLHAGDLLKYDGTKLAKAAAGTDYDGPISTTTIDLISPWVGYNEANNKIRLMRVGNRVYLDGMIKGGAAGKQIATLPEAYRIATDQRIMAAPCAGGMCRVDVYITGALQCVGPLGTGAPDQWMSLYGLSYTIY